MANIKVYSTPTCSYCLTLKAFLREKGIVFEEVDVSQDERAAREMIEKSGQMGIPVVEIDGQIVVGFDKAKISQLLKIKS